MIVRREGRGLALVCLTIVLMTTAVNAQQKILWQGAVKPAQINVYASTSITDRVTTTLKQGDVVDVILEITAMGSSWCRIAYSGQSEVLGDVLCLNLQQGHFTSKQPVHSEAVVKQTQLQAPAKSTTANFSVAAAANGSVLTNKDILDMNKAGLPPEVLVAKIKSSQCAFDTSPVSLKSLKVAGLGDSVILAMVEAPVGLPQPRSTSAETSLTDNAKSVAAPAPAPAATPAATPVPVAVTVLATSSGFAQKMSVDPIKVFIFAAPSEGGFVDPGQKQRTDSVEDLKKALDKKEGLVQIVAQKEGADLTLEVLGRGGEETGSATTSRGLYGTWNTSKDTVATVRVGLTAGTYSTLIEGKNDGRITNVWRTAANNAAKKVENWIKDNHDNLIARRVQR